MLDSPFVILMQWGYSFRFFLRHFDHIFDNELLVFYIQREREARPVNSLGSMFRQSL